MISSAADIIERHRANLLDRQLAVTAIILPVVAVLVGVGIATHPIPTLAIFLGLFGLGVLFVVPPDTLPLLAMCVFCLIPVNDLPLPSVFRAMSPGVIIFAVWLLRRTRRQVVPVPRLTKYSAYFVFLCLLTTTIFTISLSRSLVWTFAFTASVLLPIFVGGFTAKEGRLIVVGLIALATCLSCFAIAEYMLRNNPLFGHLYAEAPYPLLQHWSTYRVTTTLGHPLNNALVFAAAAAAAFAAYLETKLTRFLLAFMLTLIGVFLSGSRGALELTPIVIVVVMVSYIRARKGPLRGLGRVVVLIAASVVVAGALYAQTIGARAESGEARSSTNARYEDIRVGMARAEQLHFLGSGPGTSNSAKNEGVETIGDSRLVIENSYIQLFVSIGIPGLTLVLLLFGSLVRDGLKRRALPAAAAFLSTILVIATYNFAEGVRPGLILLGLLGGACLASSTVDSSVNQFTTRDLV